MNKFDRLIFDIGCIILIIILPYFVLKMIGIVDYVDTKMFDNKVVKQKNPFNVCDTNPNCECDPTTCGFAIEYSLFEDVSKGIHRYMCGLNKCKYSKGWKQIDCAVEYGENTEKIDVSEIQKGVV